MTTPTLADVVRHARKMKGLSQVELADRARMSQRWISDIERGVTTTPRLDALHRLASALDLDVADLLYAGQLASTRSGAERIADAFAHTELASLLDDNAAAQMRGDEQGDESETMRELVALLRTIRLNPERESLLRGILVSMGEVDQAAARAEQEAAPHRRSGVA